MDKALTPYVKGGGAKRYEAELKSMYGMDGSMDSTVGGFQVGSSSNSNLTPNPDPNPDPNQLTPTLPLPRPSTLLLPLPSTSPSPLTPPSPQAMTTDMLTVLNDIPFSIPPYFALLARAVVTLEGIALTADPDYGLVLEAYPFVARKLMSEDRPELQQALQQVLYGGGAGGMTGKVTPTRLASLLNSAAGLVAKQEGAVFIDLDAVPEEGLSLEQGLTFVLSPQAASLRVLLGTEATTAADLLLRQALRKSIPTLAARASLPQLPFLPPPPNPLEVPAPFLLPSPGSPGGVRAAFLAPGDVLEALAPKLSREEEIYALSLTDLSRSTLGREVAELVGGDLVASPLRTLRTLLAFVSSAPRDAAGVQQVPGTSGVPEAVRTQLPDLSRQLSSLLPALPTTAEASTEEGGSLGSIDDVSTAVADLNAAERAELDQQTDLVLNELRTRLQARLATL